MSKLIFGDKKSSKCENYATNDRIHNKNKISIDLDENQKKKMKVSTTIVLSNKIKRMNAFQGYCEIIEKRVKKRTVADLNMYVNASQKIPRNSYKLFDDNRSNRTNSSNRFTIDPQRVSYTKHPPNLQIDDEYQI